MASLFNATIHLETPAGTGSGFCRYASPYQVTKALQEKNRNWDPTDMKGLQEIVKAKKDLEELGRKRQELHISFE